MKIKVPFSKFQKDLIDYIKEGEIILGANNNYDIAIQYETWCQKVFTFLKIAFENEDISKEFYSCTERLSSPGVSDWSIRNLNMLVQLKLDILDGIKSNIKYLKTENSTIIPTDLSNISKNKKIFIVHGRNESIKEQVSSVLKDLELEPIILHKQSNNGNTIIEKFEKNANVGFAVILLTDDDEGRLKGVENWTDRARQNVIMEMGYFIGKLSRSRVCLLKSKNVEPPSDILGVAYEDFDDNGFWKFKLANELKSAGYPIDLNRLNL